MSRDVATNGVAAVAEATQARARAAVAASIPTTKVRTTSHGVHPHQRRSATHMTTTPAATPIIDITANHVGIVAALDEPTLGGLRVLLGQLERLGLGEHGARSRELLRREQQVNQAATQLQAEAVQRLAAAHATAVDPSTDPADALAGVAAAIRDEWAWTPPEPGRDSPAMTQARRVARAAAVRASYAMSERAEHVYRVLQDRAAQAVQACANAPLPPGLWASPEPAKLITDSDHDQSWLVLAKTADAFDAIHAAADLVRVFGGNTVLPGQARNEAWRYKNWVTATEQAGEHRNIRHELQLRWAIEHNWAPGLWRADEINPRGNADAVTPPEAARQTGPARDDRLLGTFH
jgi:hypothetical protein